MNIFSPKSAENKSIQPRPEKQYSHEKECIIGLRAGLGVVFLFCKLKILLVAKINELPVHVRYEVQLPLQAEVARQ